MTPNTDSRATSIRGGNRQVGRAWLALCVALAAHVADEAATGFLDVYNPTALAIREAWPGLPLPVFTFGTWLAGLVIALTALFLLSPSAFRGARWVRLAGGLLAVLMVANALGHTAGTLLGRTAESIRFPRPMPGFYSSPLLAAASVLLLHRLRSSRTRLVQVPMSRG